MTLSIRPDINSAAQVVSSLSTQQLPTVTEAEMTQAVRTLLIGLGENPDREGLIDTPKRVVKALQFLTKGYHESLDELLNGAVFTEDADEMVLIRDIDIFSSCEHHILPIIGRAHVAYIPNGKVIGLSKIARICEMYARRLQVQERLTLQIADALQGLLKPQGVAVVIEATESIQKTLSTGEAHYWSRSRSQLWHKGATSGHIQKVKELFYDCDGDTILLKVEQIGDIACHTGARSCFFNVVQIYPKS
jgi:GTP cyclohydrolase IA